jgi:hypothetical protein
LSADYLELWRAEMIEPSDWRDLAIEEVEPEIGRLARRVESGETVRIRVLEDSYTARRLRRLFGGGMIRQVDEAELVGEAIWELRK